MKFKIYKKTILIFSLLLFCIVLSKVNSISLPKLKPRSHNQLLTKRIFLATSLLFLAGSFFYDENDRTPGIFNTQNNYYNKVNSYWFLAFVPSFQVFGACVQYIWGGKFFLGEEYWDNEKDDWKKFSCNLSIFNPKKHFFLHLKIISLLIGLASCSMSILHYSGISRFIVFTLNSLLNLLFSQQFKNHKPNKLNSLNDKYDHLIKSIQINLNPSLQISTPDSNFRDVLQINNQFSQEVTVRSALESTQIELELVQFENLQHNNLNPIRNIQIDQTEFNLLRDIQNHNQGINIYNCLANLLLIENGILFEILGEEIRNGFLSDIFINTPSSSNSNPRNILEGILKKLKYNSHINRILTELTLRIEEPFWVSINKNYVSKKDELFNQFKQALKFDN